MPRCVFDPEPPFDHLLELAANGVAVDYEGIHRLVSPPKAAGFAILIVALTGVVVNLLATWALSKANRESITGACPRQGSARGCGRRVSRGQQHSQLLPFHVSSPSLTATIPITSAAAGSAHHQPASAFASSPTSSATER